MRMPVCSPDRIRLMWATAPRQAIGWIRMSLRKRVLKLEEQHQRADDDHRHRRCHKEVDGGVAHAEQPAEADDAGRARPSNTTHSNQETPL